MNVAIACGGSGGHLFPGVAVAETLRLRGHRVLLLVSGKDIDRQASAAAPGFEVRALPVVALPPLLSPRMLTFVARLLRSIRECRRIFDDFKPDVLLGTGGFTLAPAAWVAPPIRPAASVPSVVRSTLPAYCCRRFRRSSPGW